MSEMKQFDTWFKENISSNEGFTKGKNFQMGIKGFHSGNTNVQYDLNFIYNIVKMSLRINNTKINHSPSLWEGVHQDRSFCHGTVHAGLK